MPLNADGAAAGAPYSAKHRLVSTGLGGTSNRQCEKFSKLAERITDQFVTDDTAIVEDVRRSLLQVRQQYDSVRHEAEQKDAKLTRLKWDIRMFDNMHSQKGDEGHRLDKICQGLRDQYMEYEKEIHETKTSRKVYVHMLARIQKEQAVLRQKMLLMEEHVTRKVREEFQQSAERERANESRIKAARGSAALKADADMEREARTNAKLAMDAELERRKQATVGRAKFEEWRNTVALDAANDAFNASAGRLRKIFAIEKLCGNCLQKMTFEQIDRSNQTEDGFQRIREVTGLTDVMDIVHKFLNRDVEHEQLKGSVKDAELKLEELRQILQEIKRDTEGIAFDSNEDGSSTGAIYKEIEESERRLNDSLEEHEHSSNRLQKTVLQAEHVKRWTARIGQMLASVEEPVKVESPADVAPFFKRLHGTIEKFLEHVSEEIKNQSITSKKDVPRDDQRK
jgi:chromosome segregation ATPase